MKTIYNRLSLTVKMMGGFLTFTAWLVVVCGLSYLCLRTLSYHYQAHFHSTERSIAWLEHKAKVQELSGLIFLFNLPQSSNERQVLGEKIQAILDQASPQDESSWQGLVTVTKDVLTHLPGQDLAALQAAHRLHLEAIESALALQANHSSELLSYAYKISSYGQILLLVIVVSTSVVSLLVAYFLSNWLTSQLRAIAGQLEENAGYVSHTSQKFSTAASELSASADEQAGALLNIVTSVEEINAMLGKSSFTAQLSKNAATTAQETAVRSQEIVTHMIKAIEEIHASNGDIASRVEQNNKEVSRIVDVIGEIVNKTKVINDIVFQTKLLSFNASVEAARAGEQGKGFAVVAEEVAKLAQMSGEAAREISEILAKGTAQTQTIVDESRSKIEVLLAQSAQKVENGTLVAKQCGEALSEITGTISQVSGMMEEITSASQEQYRGIGDVGSALGRIDEVKQRHLSSSKESAETSKKLSSQADRLKGMVHVLNELVNGEGRGLWNNKNQVISLANPQGPAKTQIEAKNFKQAAA